MKIFIDSGDTAEIRKYLSWGVCDGVTTNPTILMKAGVASRAEMKARSQEIAELIHPRPLSVETTSDDPEEITRQVHEYATWAPNVAVKITITDRKGGSLLPVIYRHAVEGVRINVTAMTTLNQAMLAGIALENGTRGAATKSWGPHFLSVFGGRISEEQGVARTTEVLRTLRQWLDFHHFSSEIIVGSVRSPENIDSWATTGAHILTIPPEVLAKSQLAGRTKETVVQFLEDAKASLASLERADVSAAPVYAAETVRSLARG